MSKINVLAVLNGKPIKSKSGLKNLIFTSAELVRFVPADVPGTPLHEAVRGPADQIPTSVTVTAHNPSGRKWSAEIVRGESGTFSFK